MEGSTRRKLKKEYIPLLIALLVLVVLVLALIIVIFYKDSMGLVVPDLPEAEALDVAILDIKSGKYDGSEVSTKDSKKTKVDYEVISDYYKNGILLSSPVIEYSEDEFIIRSGPSSSDPYVSIVNKKGKLLWLNKVSFKGYNSFVIKKVIKSGEFYYAFADAKTDKSNAIVAIKFNKQGNEEKREIILKDTKNKIGDVFSIENGFVIGVHGNENIKIICLSNNLILLNNIYSLEDDDKNIFFSSKPQIESMTYSNKNVSMILKYKGRLDEYMYLLNYDISTRNVTIKEFSELSKIEKDFSGEIISYENNYYASLNNIIYHFDTSGKLIKSYDYNKISLNPSEVKVLSDDVDEDGNNITETVKNSITLYEMISYPGNILANSSTITDISYDIFDENLNLQKRIVLDINVYDKFGDNAIPLKEFFIDDKLYVVTLFGDKTKSIMIAAIG